MLSNRVLTLTDSLTIAISTQAKAMKAEGKDILSFSIGEPDFPTPDIIKQAAIDAINNKPATYTPIPGVSEVIEAIQTKLKRDHGLDYKLNQIVTNAGAKHTLFNIIQTIVNDNDEVIIQAPYWVTYPELIKFSGGKPIIIQTDESTNFKITPESLKKAISSKTKALILNSPSNPTGAVYTKDELIALGEVLKETNIIVISDEIYEKLTYNMPYTSTAAASEDLYKRTIVVNGLSKCGAMPGWRFGYFASAMDDINKAICKLQSQSTSNISSISQYAAIPALLGQADDSINMMKKAYIERRDYAVKAFREIPNIEVFNPDGAFYLFVNIKAYESDSMKFCQELLSKTGVVTVPGIGFGLDGYIRFSYATDLDSIKKGIERIKNFLA